MRRFLVKVDHFRFEILAVLFLCGLGYLVAHALVSVIGAMVMR